MRRGKQRRRGEGEADVELSMTPMIDVVFQLLIYFLVTFSAADLLANLDISRPAPDAAASESPPADMIRIAVAEAGYAINGREVSGEELNRLLEVLAEVSVDQTVLVNCSDTSLHGRLVEVLDQCAASGLTKIAVMSGQ